MSFYFNAVLEGYTFEEAIDLVVQELKLEGFGILNTVNIQETLKKKLDVDFKKYIILGACNPQLAYQALQLVDKIGLMLPCNIVVQEHEEGQVEVAIINPIESMSSVKNEHLEEIALHVRAKLLRVYKNLSERIKSSATH